MREQVETASRQCPTEVAMEIVGGKWKLMILDCLADGIHRFRALERQLSPITSRMLARQLRELEIDGMVLRTVTSTATPPRVEYRLSELGETLEPVIKSLRQWGVSYAAQAGITITKRVPDEEDSGPS